MYVCKHDMFTFNAYITPYIYKSSRSSISWMNILQYIVQRARSVVNMHILHIDPEYPLIIFILVLIII